ncbi:MAG TPA: redoxin domain-containing protein [Povalibacter sp.]
MNRLVLVTVAAACTFALPAANATDAKLGQAAPAFTLKDADGKTRSLADFKGKTVVLEWTNAECPFVKKHYSGNIQAQQGGATADDVVWLTINSGADGKQGHVDGAGAKQVIVRTGGKQTAYLLDSPGDVGRSYGAKTTPHLFVIDGKGTLQYAGAIDSIPSADAADLAKATQYVPQALADLKGGKPVRVASSQPYGCSVKY